MFQDARGKHQCKECKVGKYANGNRTACKPPEWKLPHDCIADTEYLDDTSSNKMDWRCIPKCKDIGAACNSLSSLYANETSELSETLLPKPGFWVIPERLNPNISEPFVVCKYKEDCLWNVTSKQNCRCHTKGPLCATCIVGYDRIASVCEKCRDAEVPLRLLAVFLVIIILFCTLHLFRKDVAIFGFM